jgi:hypothetical protein
MPKKNGNKPPELTPEEKRRQRNRRYYERHREKLLVSQRERYAEQTVVERAKQQFRSARYRGQAEHIPEWNDLEEAARTYVAAMIMTELTGEQYVVDHVVPLNHPLVCGLHSHQNMEVITARENALKKNLFWPGMPAITWESWKMIESTQFH